MTPKHRQALATYFCSVATSKKLKCLNMLHLAPQIADSLNCESHSPTLILMGCVVIFI